MIINSSTSLVPNIRLEGDALIMSVVGEVDLHNSPELRTEVLDQIAKHSPQRLVLNLESVPYMDSSACAVLVEALRKMRVGGGRIFLAALQPRVIGLLEIARLDSIFVVVKSEAEAMTK